MEHSVLENVRRRVAARTLIAGLEGCLVALVLTGCSDPTRPVDNEASASRAVLHGRWSRVIRIPQSVTVLGVNNHGVSVGNDGLAPTMWGERGEVKRLRHLDGDNPSGTATDLNESGVIVGVSNGAKATRWSPDGTPHALGTLNRDTRASWVSAVNESGVAVGWEWSSNYSHLTAVRWRIGVAPQRLDLPPGSTDGVATAINDRGEIVGYAWDSTGSSAVLWSPAGKVRRILANSSALGINNSGVVVGGTGQGGGAFSWTAKGGVVFLPGGGVASDINDSGIIIGYWGAELVVWTDQGRISLPLLYPTSPDELFSAATAINDCGLIVGWQSNLYTGNTVGLAWPDKCAP